jgi:quercetin dioxygenase-like cupin family protein
MTRAEFEAACRREGYEIGEGEIQPHVRRQPHAHDFDARLFVVDGSLTLLRGEDRVMFGPGEVCSVPAGTVHAEQTEADGVRLVYGRRATAGAKPAH